MTHEQIEIERKAFEEWCHEVGFDPARSKREYADYADEELEMRWDGWLARAEQSQWRGMDSAPQDGAYIMVSNDSGAWIAHWAPVAVSGYRFKQPWRSVMLNHDHSQAGGRSGPPLRWMPLPAPPVE